MPIRLVPLISIAVSCAALVAANSIPAAHGQTIEADVLAHSVTRGDVLSSSDFEGAPVSASLARTAMTADEATGMEARRNMRAGSVVREVDVQSPRVVKRGETVGLTIAGHNFSVRGSGRALADAGKGEAVRVFVPATNQTLEGVAMASGQVRILNR